MLCALGTTTLCFLLDARRSISVLCRPSLVLSLVLFFYFLFLFFNAWTASYGDLRKVLYGARRSVGQSSVFRFSVTVSPLAGPSHCSCVTAPIHHRLTHVNNISLGRPYERGVVPSPPSLIPLGHVFPHLHATSPIPKELRSASSTPAVPGPRCQIYDFRIFTV